MVTNDVLGKLTNIGGYAGLDSAIYHTKLFLRVGQQFPEIVDKVAPIVEKATLGKISRAKLKELCDDPKKLSGEVEEQLVEAIKNIDLKSILASAPGVGDILNLGKKSLETVAKTGEELYGSGKKAAEEALKTAKGVLGLEKAGTAKKGEVVKDVKANVKDTKKTDKKTDPSKPSNKGLLAKIKAFYKARPKTAIGLGLVSAYIGLKVVIPLVWKIVKWPFMIIGGLFVGKKAKGVFAKGGGAPADMMRDMHASQRAQGPDLTDKVTDAFVGDAKNGDENFLQKGLNLGNKVLENQIPGWKQLGGHKLTNMAKKLAPGKEIPLQASTDDDSGGGLFGGGKGMNPLAALAGGGAKRGGMNPLAALAGMGAKR